MSWSGWPPRTRGLATRPKAAAAGALLLLWAAAPACVPRGAVRDRAPASLTVLLYEGLDTLDPTIDQQFVTDLVLSNVYEPLVGFDANLQLQPLLASSWENPRPDVWRFHLRRDARFHDGTPLTAARVKEAFEAARDPAKATSSFMRHLQALEAVDDQTIDIRTAGPKAILAHLTFLYVAKPNAAAEFPPLVGTGPYRVREWRRGESVTVERWDGYRGAPPAANGATFLAVPDPNSRLARLGDGSADIAHDVTPAPGTLPPQVRLVHCPGQSVYYLGFSLRKGPGHPFSDWRVRKAFHLAIDREAIVRDALEGRGAVASQPVAPLVFGYNPKLVPPERDLERARRLLTSAGHGSGLDVRLDVFRRRESVARRIRDDLAALGVRVVVNPLDNAVLYDRAARGQSDFHLVGWDCTSGEASEFYEVLLHTPSGRDGQGNFGGYSNPVIDEIAETNVAVLAPSERQALLQRAAAIVMDELPILPLYTEDDVYGVREHVVLRPRADAKLHLNELALAKPR